MERVKLNKRTKQPKTNRSNDGNGGGRPQGSKHIATNADKLRLSQYARMYTQDAISALVHVCKSGVSEAARVSAANSLLNRAYGMPKQVAELTGPNNGPVMMRLDASMLAKMPDEMLAMLQAFIGALDKGDLSALVANNQADGVSADEYEETLTKH